LDSSEIVNKGQQAPSVEFLDLQVKNTGTGPAYQISLSKFQFKVLAGSGTVTINAASVLPLVIPTIGIGNSVNTRLYVNVPGTVQRFSITESGSIEDASGSSYAVSMIQAVIP
jgi:hypothetical protein